MQKQTLKKAAIFGVLFSTLALSACQSNPPRQVSRDLAPPEPQAQVDQKLSRMAERVHGELLRLREITQADIQPKKAESAPHSGPLARPITFVWSGDIISASRAISTLIGWRFEQQGATPPIVPVVRINAQARPVFEVLRDIGLQGGRESGLIVDEAGRRLVLSFEGDTPKANGRPALSAQARKGATR